MNASKHSPYDKYSVFSLLGGGGLQPVKYLLKQQMKSILLALMESNATEDASSCVTAFRGVMPVRRSLRRQGDLLFSEQVLVYQLLSIFIRITIFLVLLQSSGLSSPVLGSFGE